jgi:hypothetical protein
VYRLRDLRFCHISSAPGLPAVWTGPALGQAPPIDPDAAALTGYDSSNQTTDAPQGPEDPEPLRLRGVARVDQEIHGLFSWTIRKNHPTYIGVSLPIRDPVGGDFHEIQFWEETVEPIQFDQNSKGVYGWLLTRMSERGRIPQNMPARLEDMSPLIGMAKPASFYSRSSTALPTA